MSTSWDWSASGRVEVDDVWKGLGRYGRYQIVQLLTLTLSGFSTAFPILSGVFEGVANLHTCEPSAWLLAKNGISDNSSVEKESCEAVAYNNNSLKPKLVISTCDSYQFEQPKEQSFVSEGYSIPMSIHMIEMLPTEQRSIAGVYACMMWSLSLIIMSPIGYIMNSYGWRKMQIVFASAHVLCFLQMIFLDESLRWLVANRRLKQIRQVICKAAKYNHRNLEEVFSTALARSDAPPKTGSEATADGIAVELSLITQVSDEECEDKATGDNRPRSEEASLWNEKTNSQAEEPKSEGDATCEVTFKQETFLDLIKDSDMRFLTLSMCYIWMTVSLTYYGVTLLSSSLAGNIHLNFFLGGLTEIPSVFVMYLGLDRLGRRNTLMLLMLVTGVGLLGASIAAAFADANEGAGVAQTVLSLVARFGISGSFAAIWIYTPEIYPTNVRNLGVGIASSSSRVSGMAAPFFKLLSDVVVWGPGVIFSVACFLAAGLLFFLPETKCRPLPQTIEDVKAWRLEDAKKKQCALFAST